MMCVSCRDDVCHVVMMCDLGIWESGNLARSGNLGIWEIWKSGNPEIRKSGNLGNREIWESGKSGNLGIWESGWIWLAGSEDLAGIWDLAGWEPGFWLDLGAGWLAGSGWLETWKSLSGEHNLVEIG